jgi:PAS domain-containing protein
MIPAMASPGQQSESLNVQFLVDSMLAMVHTARPDGHLDYFNKRWLEYLGVTLDDVCGWKRRAFVHRKDVERTVARWRACVETGENFELETGVRGAGWGILLDAPPQGVTPTTSAATTSTSKI